MSDRLMMENYLLILKSTVEVYVHGTLESANKKVREHLKDNLDKIMDSQANTYDEMTKYGWYPVNNVDISIIKDVINKVNN